MRLDLFLKNGRLVKRRTIARGMCDKGRVQVNGQTAKPAKELRQGDTVTITFSSLTLVVEVLEGVAFKKAAPEELYRVTSEQRAHGKSYYE